jgi:hypothetical protein
MMGYGHGSRLGTKLIGDLRRRTRFRELPRTSTGRRTRRRGLPILCLVRGAESSFRLVLRTSIEQALTTATLSRIPHAVLVLDPAESRPPAPRTGMCCC